MDYVDSFFRPHVSNHVARTFNHRICHGDMVIAIRLLTS